MKNGLRTKMLVTTLIAALGTMLCTEAFAVSLWSDNANLFSDRKASQIGDIVVVDISEVVNDKDEGKLTSTKGSTNNIGNGFGILDFIRSFGLTSNNNATGNTKIERKKNLTGSISCLVTDVLPNGNLVIEGHKNIIASSEKMIVRFSGVIRQMDIRHNNHIESNRVANADISVSGKGSIERTQRPGLIHQVLSAIF